MTDPDTLDEIPAEKTLVLRKSITAADGVIHSELNLREPTVGEMKACNEKSGIESALFMIFKQTAIQPKTLEQLAARDYVAARVYLDSFFGDAPGIGE